MAFDPISAGITAVAGMGMTLLGGMGQARGAEALGQSEANMALYQQAVARNNAVIAGYNADYTQKAGDVAIAGHTQKVISSAGETRAALADKGVDINSGSAAAVQEGQADLGQIDAAILRQNVLKNVWNFKAQASDAEAQARLFGMQAQYARQAGRIRGRTSILGAAASTAGQASQFYRSFGNPLNIPTPWAR